MKASEAKYNASRRIAMTAITRLPPDALLPDAIRFTNEAQGFLIRLSRGDLTIQKILPWDTVSLHIDAIIYAVHAMATELAMVDSEIGERE